MPRRRGSIPVRGLRARLTGVLLASVGIALAACGAIGGDRLSDAQQVMVDMILPGSDRFITGRADHPDGHYRVGEPIGLTVQVSKPASVAVLEVLSNGATTLVFPNRAHPEARVAANVQVTIPGAGERIAADMPGPVVFKFIASDSPGSWLFARQPAAGSDFAALGASTRTISRDIGLSLKGSGTAIATLTVTVDAK